MVGITMVLAAAVVVAFMNFLLSIRFVFMGYLYTGIKMFCNPVKRMIIEMNVLLDISLLLF